MQNSSNHIPGPTSGTLTVIYPPDNIDLPVESPIEVWVYFDATEGTNANQPVLFFPGSNTSMVTADSYTDADGFARAIVKLMKPDTLGKKATFDGSVIAYIGTTPFNAVATATASMHANTSAGGPGTIETLTWSTNPAGVHNLGMPPIINVIQFKHMLADGTPANSTQVACSPLAPSQLAYFTHELALGDSVGMARNFVLTQPNYAPDPPYTAPVNLKAYAPNVIAGSDDKGGIAIASATQLGGAIPPWGKLTIGPADDMTQQRLPSGQLVQFKAVYTDEYGVPQEGKAVYVEWYITDGSFIITSPSSRNTDNASVPPVVTNPSGEIAPVTNPPNGWIRLSPTNEAGEVYFTAMVPENGRNVALSAAASSPFEGNQFINEAQAGWSGIFYDNDNPPFVNESVRITPPGTRQTIGTVAEYTVTVLEGYDPMTGRPYIPVAGQTVYWSANPADRIVFLPDTPPPSTGTVPGSRFPTVTDSNGVSKIRVLGLGTDSFFGEITAKVPNRETGTYFSHLVAVGFRPAE
ncbi:hypothetical protein [Brucella sp. IR073]|uniref:hypothetical protein n=1 Tax=unclassified Brucella TaxID=2632610 RepID=UPI003B985A81